MQNRFRERIEDPISVTPLRAIIALFILSLVMTAPIFLFGVPTGNDLPQHYQFAATYYRSLRSGDIGPSWPPDANKGFGDLGIRVYPPAGYYYLATARVIAGNWHIASSIVFLLLFFVSGIGAFLWAREWFPDSAAVVAGAAYMLAPYHANELFNAFTYAEFAASAVLPFCFLFVTRICERRTVYSIIGLAMSYGILILSHLPILIIGSAALLIYALIMMKPGVRIRATLSLGISVVLALAASAFYWVKMLSEISNVAHNTEAYTSNAFDFRTNFLGSLLLSMGSDAEARGVGFVDVMFLATLLFFMPGMILAALYDRPAFGRRTIAAAAVFGFALILATPISLPLWERLRILQLTQFPWRSMILISLAAAIFASGAASAALSAMRSSARPAAIAAIGLFVAGSAFTFAQVIRPANYSSPQGFDAAVAQFATAKSCECWWPVWAKPEALNRGGDSAPGRSITSMTSSGDSVRIQAASGPETELHPGIFYHPNWFASVDGEAAVVRTDDDGSLFIDLPADAREVELYFREPYYVTSAALLSAVTWFGLAAGVIFLRFQNITNENL